MSRKAEAERTDIYARITDRIVADLEKGVRPWMKPWSGRQHGMAASPGRCATMACPIHGMNVLLLWSEQVSRGFTSSMWMTFKQALELGGGRAQGRDRLDGRLRQPLHEVGDRRQRRRGRSGNPVPEGLFGVQRRADRRSARQLLCAAGARSAILSSGSSMPIASSATPAP